MIDMSLTHLYIGYEDVPDGIIILLDADGRFSLSVYSLLSIKM
jgi:hypothetical protein